MGWLLRLHIVRLLACHLERGLNFNNTFEDGGLRSEETVRATEPMRANRSPVPLQYDLADDTPQPRTSALPLARDLS